MQFKFDIKPEKAVQTFVGMLVFAVIISIANPDLALFGDDTEVPPAGTTLWKEGSRVCWDKKVCCDSSQSSCPTFSICEVGSRFQKKAPELYKQAQSTRPSSVTPELLLGG